MILLTKTGSQAYGTATPESDTDVLGVAIEPVGRAIGLVERFDSQVDTWAGGDRTIHSLRKFCTLALNGNPTILEALYTAHADVITMDARGSQLRELAPQFASKRAIGAFLGYLTNQLQRLNGERGQKDVNRRELVAKYGYDTKYAGHVLRLAFEGIEYAQTGHITLPLKEDHRHRVWEVKNGHIGLAEFNRRAEELLGELEMAKATSPLPATPDVAAVNQWMVDMYMQTWDATWQQQRQDKWRER